MITVGFLQLYKLDNFKVATTVACVVHYRTNENLVSVMNTPCLKFFKSRKKPTPPFFPFFPLFFAVWNPCFEKMGEFPRAIRGKSRDGKSGRERYGTGTGTVAIFPFPTDVSRPLLLLISVPAFPVPPQDELFPSHFPSHYLHIRFPSRSRFWHSFSRPTSLVVISVFSVVHYYGRSDVEGKGRSGCGRLATGEMYKHLFRFIYRYDKKM